MAEDNPDNTHSMRRVQLDCWENKTSEDEKAGGGGLGAPSFFSFSWGNQHDHKLKI